MAECYGRPEVTSVIVQPELLLSAETLAHDRPCIFATVINYLDGQTLSVVAPVLLDQFKMSSVDYSPLRGFTLMGQPEYCILEQMVLHVICKDLVAVTHVHVEHFVGGVGPDDWQISGGKRVLQP